MNAATFAGNLTANGNIVLGNASSDTVAITGAITLGLLSTLTVPIGAAATPSLNFTSSLTTGFSCAAADTLIVSTAAVARITISSAGVITIGTSGLIANVLGAVGAPSYSFTGDLNTGVYSSGADALDLTTGGVNRLAISSAGLITVGTGGVIANVLGAVTVPSYSFTGDLNTGMWSSAADTLNFSTAGSERARIDSSGNLGVGVTPASNVHVAASAAGPTAVRLGNSRADDYGLFQVYGYPQASDAYTILGIAAYSKLTGSDTQVGLMQFAKEGAVSDNKTFCVFYAHSGTSLTERLRIQSTGRIYASTAIYRALGSTQDTTTGTVNYIENGSYTTTMAAVTNTASSGTATLFFTRVGNIITCFVDSPAITPTTTALKTQVTFTLPYKTTVGNLSGSGSVRDGAAYSASAAILLSGELALIEFYPTGTNGAIAHLHFSYRIA